MNNITPVASSLRPDFEMGPSSTGSAFPFKQAPPSFPFTNRAPLSMAEQAEIEFELRYRGNMIVDQQRKIQQLEEELKHTREQIDMMASQLTSLEQDRGRDKKKPQSRYWTPDEHQRFLEALAKYGHKDVKAISLHVSTRNATQVRTHAQKYFLRLEREKRRKDENLRDPDGYNSASSDETNASPDGSMTDEINCSASISSITLPGSPAVMSESATPEASESVPVSPSIAVPASPPPPRRRRAYSLINSSQARLAALHRDVLLVNLPSWTVEDYELFTKGLVSLADRQDDIPVVCRTIHNQYLAHHSLEEVEGCYRNLLKVIKAKSLATASPKRRRTNSRPEPPVSSFSGVTPIHPLSSSCGAISIHTSSVASPVSLECNVSSLSISPTPFRVNNQSSTPAPSTAIVPSPFSNTSTTSVAAVPTNPTHPPHTPSSLLGVRSFVELGQVSPSLMDLPLLSDINIGSGVGMSGTHQGNILSGLPSPSVITPSSLWGSTLPFSFDTLMTSNLQHIPLVSHN